MLRQCLLEGVSPGCEICNGPGELIECPFRHGEGRLGLGNTLRHARAARFSGLRLLQERLLFGPQALQGRSCVSGEAALPLNVSLQLEQSLV